MRYLIYLGHPAHFHLFKNTIRDLKERGHAVEILIKKKDVLEELLQEDRVPYKNIFSKERGNNKLAMMAAVLKREIDFYKIVKAFKPDLMMGLSPEITHIGLLRGIPSIVVNEDDVNANPLLAYIAYPFATHIMSPDCCDVGRWSHKKISHPSYHELAYLHPNHFTPDQSRIQILDPDKKYFILRFAKLTAHHDAGKTGITTEIAAEIIRRLEIHGKVYITSERALEPQFEKYRIKINPSDMHHALAFATLYIGDSQTMAAEAAVLGTPAIRYNDFVGEIGYLEDLEKNFQLTFGIKTTDTPRLYEKLDELLSMPDVKKEWAKRRKSMLEKKIDLNLFMTDLFEKYTTNRKSR